MLFRSLRDDRRLLAVLLLAVDLEELEPIRICCREGGGFGFLRRLV